MAHDSLLVTPELCRTSLATGIDQSAGNPIDRDGGDFGAGLIRGFTVATRGEAKGHGGWVDSHFLQQVADAINASPSGQKSRFTHPSLSSDGLGKYLGRAKNASTDGQRVKADKHFAKSAHRTPDGDLAGYMMDRADEDPTTFGSSIVFKRDQEAEEAFRKQNTVQPGTAQFAAGDRGFKSPDPDNKGNLPHFRLKSLRSVDLVDDPATNPNGLFSRGQEIAEEAEALAAFALGLTDERPEIEQLGIDPDRAMQFLTRFMDRHGLQVVRSKTPEASMADETQNPGDETPVGADAVVEQPETKPAAPPKAEPQPQAAETQHSAAKTGKDFLTAFGQQGAVWFVEGKSYDECVKLHSAAIVAENAKLKGEVAALQAKLGRGELTPVAFDAQPSPEEKVKAEKVAKLKNAVGSDGLAKFAASIELPK